MNQRLQGGGCRRDRDNPTKRGGCSLFAFTVPSEVGGCSVRCLAVLPASEGSEAGCFCFSGGGRETKACVHVTGGGVWTAFFPARFMGGIKRAVCYPSGGRNSCLVVTVASVAVHRAAVMGRHVRTTAVLAGIRHIGWCTYFFLNFVTHFLV